MVGQASEYQQHKRRRRRRKEGGGGGGAFVWGRVKTKSRKIYKKHKTQNVTVLFLIFRKPIFSQEREETGEGGGGGTYG